MDYEIHKMNQPKTDIFSNKFLARQSTAGSSSSRFFYGVSGAVPFEWETRPGKPIKPPTEDVLPPLSPPPAVLAMSLPKPCVNVDDEPKAQRWSKAWLMKKFKKTVASHHKVVGIPRKMFTKKQQYQQHSHDQQQYQQQHYDQQRQSFEFERYDICELSRCYSSSSSFVSTLTSSSTNSFSDHNDKISSNVNVQSKALLRRRPFNCNPRGFNDFIVYFMKRV
ncbi:uncharacterized protein LOC130824487 [Amaranthus tricolor]|uniref:uncharacterized protein LOC130824487 n=1 Tax=Amaranthus tricolor TaxID=29722 RepID=UPI00258B646D|nr:uncharacterized protein LOC130824487 [Amaranthus tricolor]